ncbi:MAG: D-alanine--poly(phosphoribitol) ligase subunit DltA [Anaerolineaceae bacterium]|nr:D-alanine--poly(phosphoribitol) ligase subunit DltA [Anaerolineaceae bacterium]
MDLIERINHWAELAPDRLAHISADQSISYRDLREQTDTLATYFWRVLPHDHSPVAILGHKEPEMIVGFLGAVKSGHPYIPIDTSLPDQRIKSILEIAKASPILTPEQIKTVLMDTDGRLKFDARQLNAQDPWYIIFTSGSTGEPKGVVITKGCLESFVSWMLSEHSFIETGEVFLNQAPFSFDLSVMDLYPSLVTGATLFSLSKEVQAQTSLLFLTLAQSEISSWVSTPSFARLCLAESSFNQHMLPGLKRFLFCGETLAPAVAADLLDRFPNSEVWNTYGPTETTVATTSVKIDRRLVDRYSPLPIGYPKPDSAIYLFDENGKPVDEGEQGEIMIAGPNLSPGYLNRPDLTARAFIHIGDVPVYRTGDCGHFQDGLLFFDGRIDDQIKLHGYRIELGDIEANLRQVPGIQDAAVLPVMKDGAAQNLAAFVILTEEMTVSDFEVTRSIKRELKQRLPAYMLPHYFYYLKEFPMTPNGKVDRRRLAERLS